MCPQTLSQLNSLVEKSGFNPYLGGPVPLNADSIQLFVQQIESQKDQEGNALFVEEEKGVLVGALLVESLVFDSELYGFPMARINFLLAEGEYEQEKEIKNRLLQRCFQWCRENGIKHLSACALPDEMSKIHALEEHDFYMVAGLSTFLIDLKKYSNPSKENSVLIRPFQKSDLDPLSELSRVSFGNPKDWLDKAHADPNLPKDKSDELYVRWFQNCCNGTQAHQVLVADVEGKPAGYIALKLEEGLTQACGARAGNVPLNAVSPEYRKMGIYSSLVRAGLDWYSGQVDWVSIKTQVTTLAVHRTWLKLGAHMSSVEYAFHRFFK